LRIQRVGGDNVAGALGMVRRERENRPRRAADFLIVMARFVL